MITPPVRRGLLFILLALCYALSGIAFAGEHDYNSSYTGENLNFVAFPIGGIGAGMICLDGNGAISHVSVRNRPDMLNEPVIFSAICVKGETNTAKLLQGPVPDWKVFGRPGAANGGGGAGYGLPRFENVSFQARFPFAEITMQDSEIPLQVKLTGWSPFIPGDADNSSLPVGMFEYTFTNPTDKPIEAVWSHHSANFMGVKVPDEWGGSFDKGRTIKPLRNGFLVCQDTLPGKPYAGGSFAFWVDDPNTVVDNCWFRGGWFDGMTVLWKNVSEGNLVQNDPQEGDVPGASIYVPVNLAPGESKTVRLQFCWFVPQSDYRSGADLAEQNCTSDSACCCKTPATYVPWYAGHFYDVNEMVNYWRMHWQYLRERSTLFSDAFYSQTLPPEVLEAIAANLTILKSPTVLRQTDGHLWSFEGCHDDLGCCYGSCTHVWNYAQAIPHLFPALERSLRETEFEVSQDSTGHQTFRTSLPIRIPAHDFHAAADGQLGGIMKVYREWRISGDTPWLKTLWPEVKNSLDYCIRTWDPKGKGVLEEPHHNTYDIEYWGPEGHCTSFYLGALTAAVDMGQALGDDVSRYQGLLNKGVKFMDKDLYNGEYFDQKITWKGLEAKDPVALSEGSWTSDYSPEAKELLEKEGPKYQYGTGCLSDGVLGFWIARVCGLEAPIMNESKVKSHLDAVYKYNLKHDLFDHDNPQRPTFAMGHEGGLLLCTWPRGGALTLPFVYSNEVWTGIEYQVASHLMFEGEVEKGLDIVRVCRDRYDGRIRNPFDEYECGHWYARAMSSYGMIQSLTGVRYDAIDKTLYIDSQIGDNFTSFLSTETGFGLVGLKNGMPFVEMKLGELPVNKVNISGKVSKYMENEPNTF